MMVCARLGALKYAERGGRLTARDCFDDGRQSGKKFDRFRRADRHAAQGAAAHVAQHARRVLELQVEAARDHVEQRRPGAAIGHVHQLTPAIVSNSAELKCVADPMPALP